MLERLKLPVAAAEKMRLTFDDDKKRQLCEMADEEGDAFAEDVRRARAPPSPALLQTRRGSAHRTPSLARPSLARSHATRRLGARRPRLSSLQLSRSRTGRGHSRTGQGHSRPDASQINSIVANRGSKPRRGTGELREISARISRAHG